MDIKEAEQIRYIQIEIKMIRNELDNIEKECMYYKTNVLSDMPKVKRQHVNSADDYLKGQQELINMLECKMVLLIRCRKAFEEYINTVEDIDMRTMLKLRYIENNRYEDIGDKMYCSRTTVSRKIRRHFKAA